uniref:Uncharacterized protein n=1 Tax=Romanomermis culicivorax TaxID=13658 RepID=A0A915I9I3_ROMCU
MKNNPKEMMATGKSNYVMRCKIHNNDEGYTMGFERTKDDHFIFQLWYHTEDHIQMVVAQSVKTNEFFTPSSGYRHCVRGRVPREYNTCRGYH